MLLEQNLCRERRPEVCVPGPHQLHRVLSHARIHLPIRGSTASLVDHRGAPKLLVPRQQSQGLPPGQPHHRRARLHRSPPGKNLRQHLNAFQIPFTHLD
jgi:hypothetical protein